ncbi:hypothetical protein [Microbispora sp. ATCC PTA-5024]|uniref:hypothetical protein n=1 Tax=Microbispora sp. ATCC PTA-5024 TaxID=316330 RepID=UPI0003DD20E7|nr:hypothetical protein [Microbispora sp. ATCC PTA-5024]ETK35227.1 hypothetical protein MPTA5024_15310 [Microbispora sp. ATCC PTA-5024]
MGEPGRTAALMREVRATPLFRQLVPMESGVGWPIPVRHRPGWDGTTKVFLRLPLFGMRTVPGGGTHLYAPFATLTVEWRTGRPMEYCDLRYTRPWPVRRDPVGTFPHEAVRGPVEAYRADRERLLLLYDELAGCLADDRPFDAEAEFSALLRRLMEPPLEPYYRLLGDRFCTRFLGGS